jgi:hypothetical protein
VAISSGSSNNIVKAETIPVVVVVVNSTHIFRVGKFAPQLRLNFPEYSGNLGHPEEC